MPALTHASPILSALRASRAKAAFHPTTLQSTAFRQMQIRNAHAGMVSSKVVNGAQADWGYQWKKVGGVALMYFPVVAVVMFWPYVCEPIMNVLEG